MICIIGLFLNVVPIFAEHPEGWGLGVMFHGGPYWDNYLDNGSGGFALSFKAPLLPIYWGINFDFLNYHISTGISGDYYLIDKIFVSDINLGWYLGIGGVFGVEFWDIGFTRYTLGIRAPAGLYWHFLRNYKVINNLELILAMTPTIGIGFGDGEIRPSGGWFAEVGLRVWFK
jgi:hypothetical protein